MTTLQVVGTHSHFHDTDNLPPFEDTIISTEQVFNLIGQLDTNKANGPDGISAFMLKSISSSIALSLAKLFSCLISTGSSQQCGKFQASCLFLSQAMK